MHEFDYEVFIQGETIDLALPSETAIDKDGWHTWLNDSEINKFTGYGKVPNTAKKQRDFLRKLLEPGSDRFALLIIPKQTSKAIGVVSLSSIDHEKRSAQTALIIGGKNRGSSPFYQGFEAKARITEHAFKVLGLERVSGGQVINLKAWQQVQLLFGFIPEGIQRNAYRRGYENFDTVTSACLLEDYLRILEERRSYWPGKGALYEMIKVLPKENVVNAFQQAVNEFYKDYFSRNPLPKCPNEV